jgi:hypothetical protein
MPRRERQQDIIHHNEDHHPIGEPENHPSPTQNGDDTPDKGKDHSDQYSHDLLQIGSEVGAAVLSHPRAQSVITMDQDALADSLDPCRTVGVAR